MRKALAAAALLAAASITGVAFAQIKPPPQPVIVQTEPLVSSEPDARSLANDQDVGQARRAYRAQCERYESAGFCDCVTAGVAQALMPSEVRIAARTVGERITAEGDAAYNADSDMTIGAQSSAERIATIEGHYADACGQFRR